MANEIIDRTALQKEAIYEYYAALLVDGWTETADPDKSNGYLYKQTATITPVVSGAPAVTANSRFMSPAWYTPTRVAATDETLDAVLAIIGAGVTESGAGTITTVVTEKPSCDITVRWNLTAQ